MPIKALYLLIMIFIGVAALLLISISARDKDEDKQVDTSPILISTTEDVYATSDSGDYYNEDANLYDAHIILDNDKTTVNGRGVTFENGILTVTQGGNYYITGVLSDGKIYVNSIDETKKVKLTLASVNVSCSTDAPLFIENSPDETVLILQAGTVNSFSDTSRTVPTELTDYATAAIYSKDDLQLEGEGELVVNGNFAKGIFTKNDLDIRGGTIKVTAVDDGIRGKDSIEAENCTLMITSGGDGLRTSEEIETDKGNIDITNCIITVKSDLDSIQATGNVTLNAGKITVNSGGGATGDYAYQGEGLAGPIRGGAFNPFQNQGRPDGSIAEESSSDVPSTKGIKADRSLTVSAGEFTLNCLDDCLHAPTVTVNSGEFRLASDDDGVHGDDTVTVNGGTLVISNSYEGVEAREININAGTLLVKAADDGFNAASSSSSGVDNTQTAYGFNGGRGGMMDYDSSCVINMTNGYVLINSEGDGVDSNGSVYLSGGKMIVYGPTNGGNGALDYGGSFTVSGGTLLATGSRGMAQSVTGNNNVRVFHFNTDGEEKNVYTIADGNGSCKAAFIAPKKFEDVVFASDTLDSYTSYSFYRDGTITDYTDKFNGICFDGIYTPGTLLGTLS